MDVEIENEAQLDDSPENFWSLETWYCKDIQTEGWNHRTIYAAIDSSRCCGKFAAYIQPCYLVKSGKVIGRLITVKFSMPYCAFCRIIVWMKRHLNSSLLRTKACYTGWTPQTLRWDQKLAADVAYVLRTPFVLTCHALLFELHTSQVQMIGLLVLDMLRCRSSESVTIIRAWRVKYGLQELQYIPCALQTAHDWCRSLIRELPWIHLHKQILTTLHPPPTLPFANLQSY